jgi:hypothetical protein
LASIGINTSPTKAATVTARIDNINFSPRRTNERDTPSGASRLQLSDEGGWTAGLAWPVADADGSELLGRQQRRRDGDDRLDEHEGCRRGD